MECVSPTEADATGAQTAAGSAAKKAVKRKEKGSMALDQSATTTPTAAPGSVPVLMAEVRYAIVFADMNESAYRFVHRTLLFAGFICGGLSGSTIVPLLAKTAPQEVVVAWMLGLAALSVISFSARKAFGFDKRADDFQKAKAKFQTLEGKGWTMAQQDLQNRIATLRADAPTGGQWLAAAAYNKACKELGHPEFQMPVPISARVLAAVAD